MSDGDLRIGVDVGGTKIEAIAFGTGNQVLERTRIATPRDDYDGTVRAVRDLVTSIEGNVDQSGLVGVGIPGTVDRDSGLVKNANSTWLNGRRFDQDLTKALGREVRMANDANCFALSEAVDGAAKDASCVFGVIVGTGCGGGIAIAHRVLEGRNGIAGEWGHNPLPHPQPNEQPGPHCYCGLQGCIETWLSGPGFSARFQEDTGQLLPPEDICHRAYDGDASAALALEQYCDRFARALSNVVNILDPETVVIGGGMSNIDAIHEKVPTLLNKYAMSPHLNTRIVRNQHGDSSGVRGAAWLWPDGKGLA